MIKARPAKTGRAFVVLELLGTRWEHRAPIRAYRPSMASIVERPKKDGTSTFQVKWRQDGDWQIERFGDGPAAETFKRLVEAHGNQWPHGWVRGEGFVEEPAIPGDVPFEKWAARYIDRLTGIEDRTREDYHRDLRIHFSLLRHTTVTGAASRIDVRSGMRTPPPGAGPDR